MADDQFAPYVANNYVNDNGGIEESLMASEAATNNQQTQVASNEGVGLSQNPGVQEAYDRISSKLPKVYAPGVDERQREAINQLRSEQIQTQQTADTAKKLAQDAKGSFLNDIKEQATGVMAQMATGTVVGTALTDDPAKGLIIGMAAPVAVSAYKHGGELIDGAKEALKRIPPPGPSDLSHLPRSGPGISFRTPLYPLFTDQ